jgi:hypothetical protein
MLKKNNLLTGVLAALIFPALAWVAEYLLKTNAYILNKPAVPYFIAVGLNLFLSRYSFKRGWDQTGRGIILATFVVMILVFLFKMHPIR